MAITAGSSVSHKTLRRLAGLALVALVSLGSAACSRPAEVDSGQVAVRVNHDAISIEQLGSATPPGAVFDRQALETLVDQQLMLQAAKQGGIDRDPEVQDALETARRQILATAYAKSLTADLPAPTDAEVRAYYDGHPALFAKRRMYGLVDTAFIATPAQQKEVAGSLKGTRGAAEVAAVLRQAGLLFGTRQASLGAEALPLRAVDAMAQLDRGQSHLVSGPAEAHVYTIVDVDPAPLSEAQARGSIAAYLSSERKQALVHQQVKSLRESARIQYQGRFAPLASDVPAPAVPDARTGLSKVSLGTTSVTSRTASNGTLSDTFKAFK